MPNTSGLVNRRNVIATSDATVVSRLKQAGAIPLGVTNCSELCMWYESSNRVYGRTNNPYDLQRIVGGSSGEPRQLSTVLHEQQIKTQQGEFPRPLHAALTCRWAPAELTGLFPGQCSRPFGGPTAWHLPDVTSGIIVAHSVSLYLQTAVLVWHFGRVVPSAHVPQLAPRQR